MSSSSPPLSPHEPSVSDSGMENKSSVGKGTSKGKSKGKSKSKDKSKSKSKGKSKSKDKDRKRKSSRKEVRKAQARARMAVLKSDGEEGGKDKNGGKKKKKKKTIDLDNVPDYILRERRKGVVYLSRLPPFMRPVMLQGLLGKYGEVTRLHMEEESAQTRKKRRKRGGNKRKNYTEAWAEFADKKEAKAVAAMLNGSPMGGKKTNFYHYDLWNIKYLPGFKWHHLQKSLSVEHEQFARKLAQETHAARKDAEFYLRGVEQSRNIEMAKRRRERREKKKRKREGNAETANSDPAPRAAKRSKANDIHRQFVQRAVMEPAKDAREQSQPGKSAKISTSALKSMFG